jgi:hypothetical protein
LLSVGNGKFYKVYFKIQKNTFKISSKMVTKAYFGKFGIDAGSSEFTCQRCWFRKDDKVPSRFAEKGKNENCCILKKNAICCCVLQKKKTLNCPFL